MIGKLGALALPILAFLLLVGTIYGSSKPKG